MYHRDIVCRNRHLNILYHDGKERVVERFQTQIVSDSYVKSESTLFYGGGFSFASHPLKRMGGQNES
jgi:hypothetical protein